MAAVNRRKNLQGKNLHSKFLLKQKLLRRMAKLAIKQAPVTISRRNADRAAVEVGDQEIQAGQQHGPLQTLSVNLHGFDFKASYAASMSRELLDHIGIETERRRTVLRNKLGGNTVAFQVAAEELLSEEVAFDAYLAPEGFHEKREKEEFKGLAEWLPWVLWMFPDKEDAEGVVLIDITTTRRKAEEALGACLKIAANPEKAFEYSALHAAAFNASELDPIAQETRLANLALHEEYGLKNSKGMVEYGARGALRFRGEQALEDYNADLLALMNEPVTFQAMMAPEDFIEKLHDDNYKGDTSFVAPTVAWMYQDVEKWQAEEDRKDRKAEREEADKPKPKPRRSRKKAA